jgi:hypothetical protein
MVTVIRFAPYSHMPNSSRGIFFGCFSSIIKHCNFSPTSHTLFLIGDWFPLRISHSLSTELRDASEFYEWREAQEKLDDIKRAAHVKQLKDEMVQSAEAAKQAMARQLAENSAVATQMKIEVQWRSDGST